MWRGFEILTAIRREKPPIHHVTNYVTPGDCANITMSIGALPVMAHALEEHHRGLLYTFELNKAFFV
jgi:hydroxyethylthiazole kinase-like sugar kinase family protein